MTTRKQLPTRVGMNRSLFSSSDCRRTTPHASGDEPPFAFVRRSKCSNSPREWG